MWRFIWLLVGSLFLFGLAGCSSGESEQPPTEEESLPAYRYDNVPAAADMSAVAAEYRAISKWGKTDITYYFVNSSNKVDGELEYQIVSQAFDTWASYTPLTFTRVTNRGEADIEVAWAAGDHGGEEAFDGPGGILAYATFPNPFVDRKLVLRFDEDERWRTDGVNDVDLYTVALHEIGHALGLAHSRDPLAVMFASYAGPARGLSPDDIAGIQDLYGASVAQPPEPPTPGETPPPSNQVDSDRDGLSDAEEVFITGTDPNNADSDGDGLGDGVEILNRLNPLNPDMDRDGVSDGDEIKQGTNPFFPNLAADASPELIQQVSQFLAKAIEAEKQAYLKGDASLLETIYAQDVRQLLNEQINVLNNQGWRQVSHFDYYNSYIDDVRVVTQREIQVDTCEIWTSVIFNLADGQAVRSEGPTLIPQTLTISRLDTGWFITEVEFFTPPSFCN